MSDDANEIVFDPRAALAAGPRTTALAAAEARVSREIEGMLVVAMRFPRSEERAREQLLKACERPKFAEEALYEFPRGGKTIKGPSIRLAEAAARSWRNLTFGWNEVEKFAGRSKVDAWAWDMETNLLVRHEVIVEHVRDKRSGTVELVSSRDVLEAVANKAQRVVRGCILNLMPPDIIDEAVEKCERVATQEQLKLPLDQRIARLVEAYGKLNVTPEMLSERVRHPVSQCSPDEVTGLGRLYVSVRDGFVDASELFLPQAEAAASSSSSRARPEPDAPRASHVVLEQPGGGVPADNGKDRVAAPGVTGTGQPPGAAPSAAQPAAAQPAAVGEKPRKRTPRTRDTGNSAPDLPKPEMLPEQGSQASPATPAATVATVAPAPTPTPTPAQVPAAGTAATVVPRREEHTLFPEPIQDPPADGKAPFDPNSPVTVGILKGMQRAELTSRHSELLRRKWSDDGINLDDMNELRAIEDELERRRK